MSTLPHEMIHITFKCIMHLHGHWNKVVPFLKPFIFADLSNGAKFCNCNYWLINDTQSYRFSHWVSNHHIDNENLVLSDQFVMKFLT